MIRLLRRSAAQARYLLIGSFVLLFGFQLIIVGQAEEIQRTQTFGRVAELMPAFLQRGLGSRAMLLATFRGTVAFGYFHPVVCLIVAVMAMYFTTEPAHEIESGLVDLELSRAVPRSRLLTRSVLLSEVAVATAAALMGAGTLLGARLFNAGGMDLPTLGVRARLLANLFAVGSCFGGYGLLLAAWSRRWMTAFTTAALTAVVLYLVDFLAIGWRAMRVAAWLSPFHYYKALSIIAGDAPIGRDIAILFGAGSVFACAAYWRFGRRDL
jgi:ABC-type transport system involved in multi-copper enzyme maturation permease subunit